MSMIDFGVRSVPPCDDCWDGHCTMNCSVNPDRRPPPPPTRADILAAIELPLRNYVEIDSNGWVSFCYPARTGAFIAITNRALELVKEVGRGSARYRKIAQQEAERYLADHVAEDELIHQQWDAYLEARRKNRP